MPSDLKAWSDRLVFVSEPVMRKVAGIDSTQGLQGVGVLALPSSFCNLEATRTSSFEWVSCPRRLLVLDAIQVRICQVTFSLSLFFSEFLLRTLASVPCDFISG